MKVDVYFLAKTANSEKSKIDLVSTINPIAAEAQYFILCKKYQNVAGKVIVKPYNGVTLNAEYLTGECNKVDREQDLERHRMIWARGADWTKPCPLQMRGLAMACCGSQRGYQTRFAELLDVDGRTWRNWAKLINNKRKIPWYAWYAALCLFMNKI